MHAIRGLDNKESLMQASVCLCGGGVKEREREEDSRTWGERTLSVCATLRKKKKKSGPAREECSQCCNFSVWSSHLSIGILCGYSFSLFLGVYVACIYMYAGEGRPVLFHPHYYSVGRSRADSSRGEAREPRLFMDGFSFNFRQGSLVWLSPVSLVVLSLAFRVLTHRCNVHREIGGCKRAITHREKHTLVFIDI